MASVAHCLFPGALSSFKGTDVTFEKFPDRVQHLIQETTPNVRVKTAVFPVYETKGELVRWDHELGTGVYTSDFRLRIQTAATERFVDWLTTLTVEEEVNHGQGGGAGKAKIVLCGHRRVLLFSMPRKLHLD
jgi:hypothetical protein